MNDKIIEIAKDAGAEIYQIDAGYGTITKTVLYDEDINKFAELLMQDMHRKVIASILITDVVIAEKGQKPTSEDYIRAINHDFGVD